MSSNTPQDNEDAGRSPPSSPRQNAEGIRLYTSSMDLDASFRQRIQEYASATRPNSGSSTSVQPPSDVASSQVVTPETSPKVSKPALSKASTAAEDGKRSDGDKSHVTEVKPSPTLNSGTLVTGSNPGQARTGLCGDKSDRPKTAPERESKDHAFRSNRSNTN